MHRCCESKWSFSFAPPPPSPKLNFWLRPWREWSEILRDCRSTLRFQEREITEAARVQVCLVWVCRGKVRALLRRLELGFVRERERERESYELQKWDGLMCLWRFIYKDRCGAVWFLLVYSSQLRRFHRTDIGTSFCLLSSNSNLSVGMLSGVTPSVANS